MKLLDSGIKRRAVIDAVNKLKKSEFGATAIKVELEAQFNRGENCGGTHSCGECDGDYEDVEQSCVNCEGNGCDNCENGETTYCQYCDHGEVECDDCGNSEFGDEGYCEDWIRYRLREYGLCDDNNQNTGALRYLNFYNDGSVDSELTLTLMLDDPEIVFVLPKIVQIWNALGEEIGNSVDVDGAGMHIALINEPNGTYPSSSNNRQRDMFYKFSKSMTTLLPALYFLAANTNRTRGLRYRKPQIQCTYDDGEKYSAIAYRSGALEFRVFDTCYDTPEKILDDIVVISNCMRYWKTEYKPVNLKNITTYKFGSDGVELERLYRTTTHLDLLNAGLTKLKPSYYTIREIKDQRQFKVCKQTLKSRDIKYRKGLDTEYEEYSERYKWSCIARKHREISRLLEMNIDVIPQQELMQRDMNQIEREAQEKVNIEMRQKLEIDTFKANKFQDYLNKLQGSYTLHV
jgi:predicted transport protein